MQSKILSCHLGPEISPEHFISEHFFMYLIEGSITAYDGKDTYTVHPGEITIARKNHFVRYTKHSVNNVFRKVIIAFDKPFLEYFLERHPVESIASENTGAFITLPDTPRISNYIQSLEPYYTGDLEIEAGFEDIKREELMLILLKAEPWLANVFFNFAMPQKIDLEAFMHRNFRFNVSLDRFAFMTGRSLSSFKRDFLKVFGTTPGKWLTAKRLEEAHFLIKNTGARPGEVYNDLGFEDFSHFSFAFRKHFGVTPTEVI
ncbi:AraC family transcriptional regulator [Flavobacterium akiainvivens]|uniref:AraC family transcriptional regulator n=1 Tax=Flavobacterium akiainvivens TaxID=1202724 RepID=A0A0M9VJ72_9FLAO|nr:AraC family transcriptional regulator [Flavobacterium akiainvivens]KOS07412.1 AraC family transcriptional regulator [Flavobacterium akiainvivens]SFQ47839.1 AraC-type DNA-binding protein [Flavobacterium akiainvivens]